MNDRQFEDAGVEATLVERAQAGQLAAYNQLVLRFQTRAYNLAYYMLGDAETAADATQDSFLKAYRNLGQFRGGSFQAWLLRIVANTCYDELRKRQRHNAHVTTIDEDAEESEAMAIPDPAERPEQTVLRRELAASIRAAINGLPPDQRAVLVMSDVEGMTYQDIASTVGIPVGTVKSRLARARAGVRYRLEKQRDVLPRQALAPGMARADY